MEPTLSENRKPPTKGRMPREQREHQIIAVAESVFARRGFDGSSMEEIARDAGVDRALLYQYFQNKRGLYESCVASALADLQRRVYTAVAGMADETDENARQEMARTAVRVFFEFVRDHGDGWDVLFGAGWSLEPGAGDERPPPDMLQFVVNLVSIDFGEAPSERIRATASSLLGASWAVSLWWRNQSGMSLDEIADQHYEFCMAALEPLRQPGATSS